MPETSPFDGHIIDPSRVDRLERQVEHMDSRMTIVERSQAIQEERLSQAVTGLADARAEQRDGFNRLERLLERRLGAQTRWWVGIGTALVVVLIGVVVDLAGRL